MAEFVLSDFPLGALAAVTVGLQAAPGVAASWHLQKVVVSSDGDKCWNFPCNDWLGGSAGSPLQRVLVASRCATQITFKVSKVSTLYVINDGQLFTWGFSQFDVLRRLRFLLWQ